MRLIEGRLGATKVVVEADVAAIRCVLGNDCPVEDVWYLLDPVDSVAVQIVQFGVQRQNRAGHVATNAAVTVNLKNRIRLPFYHIVRHYIFSTMSHHRSEIHIYLVSTRPTSKTTPLTEIASISLSSNSLTL